MKHILPMLAAILLTTLSANAYAHKHKNNHDYNLKKAYEVLNEEKDEAKALDLVNKQLRETPDNVDAFVLRVWLLRHKNDWASALQAINHAIEVNKPKKSGAAMSTLFLWKAYLYYDARDYETAVANNKKGYDILNRDDKDDSHNINFDYDLS